MTREQASRLLRDELNKYGLNDWGVRLTTNINQNFLGLCSHKDKCIILNAHHLDIHPDLDIVDTIKHEVAHAIVGAGNRHNEIWATKAKEIGCTNTLPCSTLSFTPEIIDAIRSGADVEISFEEEIIRRPKYQITRLQDKCEVCGKVAVTKNELLIESKDDFKPDEKFIWLECGHLLVKKIPKGTPFHSIVWNSKSSDCKHEWNKNKCIKCDGFRPYAFQSDGMRFIEAALAVNKGAAIFDEMGLGKTIQALGYIKFHPEQWPVLYVVKSAIKFQWFKQIIDILGDEFVGQIINSSNDIIIPGLKTYIISFDMLVFKTRKSKSGKEIKQGFDISKFDGIIKTVVIDECQQVKNPDSSRTQQVRRIVKDKAVIALSGTPWKNRGSEFFSILNMMAPLKFPSYQGYLDRWVDWYYEGNVRKQGGINKPEKFKEYIKDIAIRRERSEVMSELPSINRMRLYIQLNEIAQDTYDDEVSEFVKWYNNAVIGGEEDSAMNSMNILAKLSRMRHITGLAKIPATVAFTEEFVENTDRKLLIGVHHKDVGELLYRELFEKYSKEIKVIKLTGEQSSEERFHIQESFNRADRVIMVASTLASGEGLNLQTCSDAVLHERQWNPANEEQFEGRMIRIGQMATQVNCTYVTSEGTIDDLFDKIIENKRNQFHAAMNKGSVSQWNQTNIAKELAEAIINKHKQKNKGKSVNFTNKTQLVRS